MLARKSDQELNDLQAELLARIAQLESIQFYKKVVTQMEKNDIILKLIKQKKRVQKELVNAQHVKKTEQARLLLDRLHNIETELLAIPLYQQYLSAIEEAQEVLDIISVHIQKELALEAIERQE